MADRPKPPTLSCDGTTTSSPESSPPLTNDGTAEVFGLLTGQFDLAPPFARRIFVNRTLRLDRIAWVGFDMDFTLLRYRDEAMGPLLYEKARDKLVQAGYPRALEAMDYDDARAMRGILIDKECGNLLQMNRHRHVNTAYLGHQRLDKEARRQYRIDPLQLSTSDDGVRRFRLVDTQFGVPEAALYADVIAWYQAHEPATTLDYHKLYDDVRAAMDTAHADLTIHHAILADLPRYVHPDPELATMLRRFRMWGKKLFLLTNSDWEYTTNAMAFLLDGQHPESEAPPTHWSDYFDLVGVRAAKPSFFASEAPFAQLSQAGEELGSSETIPPGKGVRLVRGGNHKALHNFLGVDGERVLYVGDHIYGDILRTRRASTWRTMFVMEEFEQELTQLQEVQAELQQWQELTAQRNQIDAAIHHQNMLLERLEQWAQEQDAPAGSLPEQLSAAAMAQAHSRLEQLRQELDTQINRVDALHEQIHQRFNPYWGMLFREGQSTSYLAEQVRKFACLYTSRATNFLYYAPTQYFRPPHYKLPHEHP